MRSQMRTNYSHKGKRLSAWRYRDWLNSRGTKTNKSDAIQFSHPKQCSKSSSCSSFPEPVSYEQGTDIADDIMHESEEIEEGEIVENRCCIPTNSADINIPCKGHQESESSKQYSFGYESGTSRLDAKNDLEHEISSRQEVCYRQEVKGEAKDGQWYVSRNFVQELKGDENLSEQGELEEGEIVESPESKMCYQHYAPEEDDELEEGEIRECPDTETCPEFMQVELISQHPEAKMDPIVSKSPPSSTDQGPSSSHLKRFFRSDEAAKSTLRPSPLNVGLPPPFERIGYSPVVLSNNLPRSSIGHAFQPQMVAGATTELRAPAPHLCCFK